MSSSLVYLRVAGELRECLVRGREAELMINLNNRAVIPGCDRKQLSIDLEAAASDIVKSGNYEVRDERG